MKEQAKHILWPLWATLTGLAVIVLGALFAIAPVWQPGYGTAAYQPPQSALTEQAPPTAQPLDLNTATAVELTALPGIGTAKAQAIVQYREEHGPFATLQDVAAVSGVSDKIIGGWGGLACVEAAPGTEIPK